MVVTAVLWRYWQEQQYEEAVTEVCALLDVKEESFASDQELLGAAGDTDERRYGSPEVSNLALFGCSCCNRLAEKHLRGDWRVACHWCALARRLEGLAHGTAPWALSRFKRLFNAAEAIRVAGKEAKGGTAECQQYHLASERCLRACESIWQRWPTCTSSPESIYTCSLDVANSCCQKAPPAIFWGQVFTEWSRHFDPGLAEVSWQLKDKHLLSLYISIVIYCGSVFILVYWKVA